MKDFDNQSGRTGLTIDYSGLGTVCIDELGHAMWEDFQIVRNTYNARFVNGLLLHLPVTNEYGEPIKIRHPGGPVIYRLHRAITGRHAGITICRGQKPQHGDALLHRS